MNSIVLDGCRSTPLASYLKALGVLRLVAEQTDPAVRGWWEGERFHLSAGIDAEDLKTFLLTDYRPTPIVAPWNGGSGYYPKDNKVGIDALAASTAARFLPYREAIGLGVDLIRRHALLERPADEAKTRLIAALRAEGDRDLVAWLDTALALTPDRLAFPPLLGTGGNDGRLDFTNNFMQRLVELIPMDGSPPSDQAAHELDAALFGTPVSALASAAIGQFSPGAAGGPNSAAGFEGGSLVNRWDFVLMLEGTLIFAGGVSRRLQDSSPAYLSYPFTVRAAAVGYGSASAEEQGASRGELWAPLWGRPTSYVEVRSLFREGRLSLGARQARDGVDAARAISRLGADRSVESFERYGFVQRQGLAYLAAPLGRIRVKADPRSRLVDELDRNDWLERVRSKASSDETPASLSQAMRALEDGIIALADRPDTHGAMQDLLIAFGAVVQVIGTRPKLREALQAPPLLSSAWVDAADDGSMEFALATAIAGMQARLPDAQGERRFGLPLRVHIAPIDPERLTPLWDQENGGPLVVWGPGPLVDNLCAVAQRRLLEQMRRPLPEPPFERAFDWEARRPVAAGSEEIAAFIAGHTQDRRIGDLLLGLAWTKLRRPKFRGRRTLPSFGYACLKPLFTPRSVFQRFQKREEKAIEIPQLPIPSGLPTQLAAGRVHEAVRLAQERARASGLATPFLDLRAPRQTRATDFRAGRRLLASLIIPVRPSVVRACLSQAYPPLNTESVDAS